jgi:hypothetical protein
MVAQIGCGRGIVFQHGECLLVTGYLRRSTLDETNRDRYILPATKLECVA